MFTFTVQYRLAGNIFESKYYLPQEAATDAVVAGTAIFGALRQMQTVDVEYLSLILRDMTAPYNAQVIDIPATDVNGQVGGEATMPAITFLEFVFLKAVGRGKVTHYIRGCGANDITDLGKWNYSSRGVGDFDAGATVPLASAVYNGFADSVELHSCDPNGNGIVATGVVSIGSRRATRRL